ncbi:PREDICTED: adenylate kinase 8 isoform X2 [Rhinopithecus bieti]|uniref:adenylate kinase 8 isoform X2 n=1 Tax=Rhinopithecus bieti TaxID=61621 RepID=UPI00083C0159|nr:PREDICTED: adenylate kinase 8 isoform X2 [Rhinopithecus bieti]
MDSTTAPHRIPPEMPQYGEENHIFELMQNMLEQLLIHQPEDPIPFMIQHLHKDNDNVPRIVILGPPASGKTTIAMWLCKHLNSSLLTLENLVLNEFSFTATKARRLYLQRKTIPSVLLVQLIQERLAEEDCIKRGWILDGIPETREQALRIQTLGITPRHVIVLSAPDTVLIERNLGKRIDPQTGEIYHTTFDWPPESEIQNRLMVPEDISELETAQKLLEYHRNIIRVIPSYPKILKVISADQPCVDVFYQALTYVQSNHRTNAPFTPRVLLLGPVGSGKSLQAALLAQKYRLVNVCCGQLLKEAVADRTTFGELVRPFFEKEMAVPDSLLMKVLSQRLNQQDCIQKGWVLHGVPRDLDQAHLLNSLGYNPNRYHLMYKPPPTMEIQARLLQNPKDAEEQVKLKVDLFYRNSADLEQLYGSAITVNGDQDPYTVFEYIESGIINPLPKKIP